MLSSSVSLLRSESEGFPASFHALNHNPAVREHPLVRRSTAMGLATSANPARLRLFSLPPLAASASNRGWTNVQLSLTQRKASLYGLS